MSAERSIVDFLKDLEAECFRWYECLEAVLEDNVVLKDEVSELSLLGSCSG